MSRAEGDTVYFDWATYADGWLDMDKTTKPAMKEFLECFVGKQIAAGTTRHVFESRYDKSLVIKIQKHYETQNAVEVATWDRWKDYPKVAKWLAPVVARSSSMRVIVQQRTIPMLRAPKLIPDFLTDRKVQNYGLLGKQVVCHDYGLGLYVADGCNFKMVPANWWDVGTGDHYDKR